MISIYSQYEYSFEQQHHIPLPAIYLAWLEINCVLHMLEVEKDKTTQSQPMHFAAGNHNGAEVVETVQSSPSLGKSPSVVQLSPASNLRPRQTKRFGMFWEFGAIND